MVEVKICGVTTVEDALAAAELGASAIGLNFVPTSPRRIGVREAAAVSRAVRRSFEGAVRIVGVVADLAPPALRALLRDAELDLLQLHGSETADMLRSLLPSAYKALRIATAEDVAEALAFPGEHVLCDARVEGSLGGTGATFDWSLVRDLARARKLILAGGLTPENVGPAVREVEPHAVDVASGVERAPGVKDRDRMRAFIEAARAGGR